MIKRIASQREILFFLLFIYRNRIVVCQVVIVFCICNMALRVRNIGIYLSAIVCLMYIFISRVIEETRVLLFSTINVFFFITSRSIIDTFENTRKSYLEFCFSVMF